MPDCIRSLCHQETIVIRNPYATRPWQHVLEPLSGYLLLTKKLYLDSQNSYTSAWNFGPLSAECRSVINIVQDAIKIWGKGEYVVEADVSERFHEDTLLQLNCDKANLRLGWHPTWNYQDSIQRTVEWYRRWHAGENVWELTTEQIKIYMDTRNERDGTRDD